MNHKKKQKTKIRDVMTKDCPRLRVIKKSIMKLRTTPFLVRLSRKMSLTDVVAVFLRRFSFKILKCCVVTF